MVQRPDRTAKSRLVPALAPSLHSVLTGSVAALLSGNPEIKSSFNVYSCCVLVHEAVFEGSNVDFGMGHRNAGLPLPEYKAGTEFGRGFTSGEPQR